MRYVWTGVAVIAALAFAAPVWAQPASPSGGNPMGMPGPNPGGPGLTPYSTGPNPGGAALSGPRTAPSAMPESTSATPPSHRHGHHMAQGKASHHPSRFPNLQGNVANELNQAELARLQSGNFTPPAPPEMSQGAPSESAGPTHANPSQMNRMSTGGRATSGGPR